MEFVKLCLGDRNFPFVYRKVPVGLGGRIKLFFYTGQEVQVRWPNALVEKAILGIQKPNNTAFSIPTVSKNVNGMWLNIPLTCLEVAYQDISKQEIYGQIWDTLVQLAGAVESQRQDFVYTMITSNIAAYGFASLLGLHGKLQAGGPKYMVNYQGLQTPAREQATRDINEMLQRLPYFPPGPSLRS